MWVRPPPSAPVINKTKVDDCMQKQLDHSEFKQNQPKNKNNIIFILENFEHMENIGSALRLADAFNIDKVIIVEDNIINEEKIKKTARNCDKTVNYSVVEKIDDALEEIELKGYTPINIEITSTSRPLRTVNFAQYGKIALIVGNERHGISEHTLERVPLSAHIEMYGNNSSMNVSTALAIATYQASEDLLSKKNFRVR